MLYLLDANVLIRANEDYYGIDQVPQFWEWLVDRAATGVVKMPFEIHDEIAIANCPLPDWITDKDVRDVLVLDEEVDSQIFNHVLATGYGPDLTDSELEKIGRDPFLAAYAKMGAGRVVVTKEVSKPSRTRGNRKVPDVCNSVGVPWVTDFAFFKAAGFNTK